MKFKNVLIALLSCLILTACSEPQTNSPSSESKDCEIHQYTEGGLNYVDVYIDTYRSYRIDMDSGVVYFCSGGTGHSYMTAKLHPDGKPYVLDELEFADQIRQALEKSK